MVTELNTDTDTGPDADTDTQDAPTTVPSWTRRGLIAGAAAAGAGAAAGLMLGATPAGAQGTQGNALICGEDNTATALTQISTTIGNGLLGATTADTFAGIQGVDNSTGGGFGLFAESAVGIGVYGRPNAGGSGLLATGQVAAVVGDSSTSDGVVGLSSSKDGVSGITSVDGQSGVSGIDQSSTGGNGIFGTSATGTGARGITTADGGFGVVGNDQSGTGGTGVYGLSDAGTGISGDSNQAIGVSGISVGQSGLLGSQLAGTVGESDTNIGVLGLSTAASGVTGLTSGDGIAGVTGTGTAGTGVLGTSVADSGLPGGSVPGTAGVIGDSTTNPGIVGTSSGDSGVIGVTIATGSSGVSGMSDTGYGVSATGGLAPLFLQPAATAGAPTTGAHAVGELYTDKNGALFCSVAPGTPGTWVQLSAGAVYANGAFCLLPSPIRLLDTRVGATDAVTQPAVPVASGTTFTLQVTGATQDSISVPLGAVAVIGNVTAVDAVARGFLTCWPDGVTQPKTSSLNFPATTSVANGVTVALSSAGKMDIFASQTTDVIFDATGFVA